MREEPVAKRPSLLIQIFCLGNEIQFRDVDSRRAGHVAEMATNAEVDPFVDGRLFEPPKSLSAGARLLRPRKLGCDARNRADCRAGGTANTNIGIIFRPSFFHE